jgi:hypothetical protein
MTAPDDGKTHVRMPPRLAADESRKGTYRRSRRGVAPVDRRTSRRLLCLGRPARFGRFIATTGPLARDPEHARLAKVAAVTPLTGRRDLDGLPALTALRSELGGEGAAGVGSCLGEGLPV